MILISKKRTNLVEVERKLAGDGAVEARFEVGRPVLTQDVLTTCVLFADTADARENAFSAVNVLDGRFPEEKVNVLAHVERTHKVRLCKLITKNSLSGRGSLQKWALFPKLRIRG